MISTSRDSYHVGNCWLAIALQFKLPSTHPISFRLEEFNHHFGMLFETVKFTLLDFEMANENDWLGHESLLSQVELNITAVVDQ
jgi:hypothetical protein